MFTLKFKISKSKNYPIVEKLAHKFSDYTLEENTNIVYLSIKELFEKWDFFNLMFWKTVDWKGTTFGYDNYNLHSHCDKTRMFYALQEAHNTWICMSEYYLSSIAPAYFFSEKLDEIKKDTINDEYINRILDKISIAKNKEEYRHEFGYLNFQTPLRNSDFAGRRLRREEKKRGENDADHIGTIEETGK